MRRSGELFRFPLAEHPNPKRDLVLAGDEAKQDAPTDKLRLRAFHQSYEISCEMFGH